MTPDSILFRFLLAGGVVLLVWAALLLMWRAVAARQLEQRVLSVTSGQGGGYRKAPATPLGWVRGGLQSIGRAVRSHTGFYSEQDIFALEGMIAGSGFSPQTVLPVLLGVKVVMLVAVPLAVFTYAELAGYTGGHAVVATCLSLPVGLLAPDWIVQLLRRPYLAALRRGVPDALDLLVVCSEAGMGLESALDRVSQEMAHSNPPTAVALGKLLDELRVLPDRREAFRNFATRTGVEGARRIATMLGQSMQYGTPLSQALRTVAIDLRRERMTALEAKAVRVPVLLVLPLVLFLMPTLFIVLTGPSVLRLFDTIRAVAHH